MTCFWCNESIADGDDVVPHDVLGPDGMARSIAHRECLVLRVVGHIYSVCHCTNMAGYTNKRQAALELARRMRGEPAIQGGN